ncbi:hypothetical protein [Noviherbaspirillum humi]|nr:hypothetical protein [Noviherbaspirillum humi]
MPWVQGASMVLLYLGVAVLTELRGGMLRTPATPALAQAVKAVPAAPARAPMAEAAAGLAAPGGRQGIDPRELPYEGKPPDAPAARATLPPEQPLALAETAPAGRHANGGTPAGAAPARQAERIEKRHAPRQQMQADASASARAAKRKDAGAKVKARAAHWPGAYRTAQCEREPSLFAREACKWRLCSGQWGRNGCPSYHHPPQER